MTQADRVLALLRKRGIHGITANDFDPGPNGTVTDGGIRFTRLAARIRDLRDKGYRIVKADRPGRFDTYVLVGVEEQDTYEHPKPHADGTPREWVCDRCHAHVRDRIGPVCPGGHAARLVTVVSPTGTLAYGRAERERRAA